MCALFLTCALMGCGVKGRPIAPKTPPPLGRGEPTYKEKQLKKKTNSSGTAQPAESDEK